MSCLSASINLLGGDRLGVAAPDVIDALEQAHPSYAGLTQHVAVEPRQRAGAVAVMQEPVAADAHIGYRESGGVLCADSRALSTAGHELLAS